MIPQFLLASLCLLLTLVGTVLFAFGMAGTRRRVSLLAAAAACIAGALSLFAYALTFGSDQAASVDTKQALADMLPGCPDVAAEFRQAGTDGLSQRQARALIEACVDARLQSAAKESSDPTGDR